MLGRLWTWLHPVLEPECELPSSFISFVSPDRTELREAGAVFDPQRPRAEWLARRG